jgi:hypothetical protein
MGTWLPCERRHLLDLLICTMETIRLLQLCTLGLFRASIV